MGQLECGIGARCLQMRSLLAGSRMQTDGQLKDIADISQVEISILMGRTAHLSPFG